MFDFLTLMAVAILAAVILCGLLFFLLSRKRQSPEAKLAEQYLSEELPIDAGNAEEIDALLTGMKAKLAGLNQELAMTKEMLNTASREKIDDQEMQKDLSAQIADLEAKLSDQKRNHDAAQDQLGSELYNVGQEKGRLEAREVHLAQERDEFREKADASEQELRVQMEEAKTAHDKLDQTLRQQIDEADAREAKLNRKLNEARSEFVELDARFQTLQQEVTAQEKQLSESQEALEAAGEQSRKDVAHWQEEAGRLRTELMALKEAHEAENAKSETQIEALELEKSELEAERENISADKSSLLKKNELVESEIRTIVSRYEEQIATLQDSADEYAAVLEHEKTDIASREKALQEELEIMRAEKAKLNKERDQLRKSESAALVDRNAALSQLKDSENQSQLAAREAEKTRSSQNAIKYKLEKAEEAAKKDRETTNRTVVALEAITRDYENARAELEASGARAEDMEALREQMRAQRADFEARIDASTKRISGLKAERDELRDRMAKLEEETKLPTGVPQGRVFIRRRAGRFGIIYENAQGFALSYSARFTTHQIGPLEAPNLPRASQARETFVPLPGAIVEQAEMGEPVKFELTATDAKNPEFENVWEGHFRVEPATHRIELLSA